MTNVNERQKPQLNIGFVTCNCMVCGEEFEGEEPKMCCSGHLCGCMGLPIDPVICSEECYNKLPFRNGGQPVGILNKTKLEPKL